MECLLTNFRVFFFVRSSDILYFFHFYQHLFCKHRKEFCRIHIRFVVKEENSFFPTTSLCPAGSEEDDTARVAEPSSEGGNQQVPREGAVFLLRFLIGVCLEADVKTKHWLWFNFCFIIIFSIFSSLKRYKDDGFVYFVLLVFCWVWFFFSPDSDTLLCGCCSWCCSQFI